MRNFLETELIGLKAQLEEAVARSNMLRGAIVAHEATLKKLLEPTEPTEKEA